MKPFPKINIPISFSLEGMGIPVIPVNLFDTDNHILLLIDTGADKSIMDISVYEYFKDRVTEISSGKQVSTASNSIESAISVRFDFAYDDHRYSEMFLCMDCSNGFDKVKQETGHRIHGILGCDFLLRHQWVIDLEKCVILAK